jgi:hypothetical protein
MIFAIVEYKYDDEYSYICIYIAVYFESYYMQVDLDSDG